MKSELNSRQWALYNALKEQGDEWRVQAEIATLIPEYNYDGSEDWRLFHDSPARHLMTADIRAINESTVIQKVIISSGKGIKIANKDEFDRYIRKEIMSSVRRLMRAKRKAAKGAKDGQMRIVFGSERDTVKAFLDSDRAFGERLKSTRLLIGLKAREVAEQLRASGFHVDEPLLSKFENGHALPNKSMLSKLAEIYAVSVDFLLTGDLSAEAEINEINGLQAVKGG